MPGEGIDLGLSGKVALVTARAPESAAASQAGSRGRAAGWR